MMRKFSSGNVLFLNVTWGVNADSEYPSAQKSGLLKHHW